MSENHFRNISQSTYDRITDLLRDTGDRFPRAIHPVDARDLLEAYEAAVTLLDQVHNSHAGVRMSLNEQVDAFLCLPDRFPRIHRVVIDDGEPLSYSARGELRPADSDDYEP